jgi:cytochrome c biogenesis protein CcdA
LLSATLQRRFASATSSLSTFGDHLLDGIKIDGLTGQLVIGLVLGLIWAPCVGPTLGAAATLASQGSNLGQVAAVMAVFGVGAGLPLALIGLGSRNVISQSRSKLLKAGMFGKSLLGALLLVLGVLILAGWDKSLEAFLLSISPAWLTALTTKF